MLANRKQKSWPHEGAVLCVINPKVEEAEAGRLLSVRLERAT